MLTCGQSLWWCKHAALTLLHVLIRADFSFSLKNIVIFMWVEFVGSIVLREFSLSDWFSPSPKTQHLCDFLCYALICILLSKKI